MAILKIARMGHWVLGQRAAPVVDPSAPEIHRLVEDMIETMEDAAGTGLAAPQVHVSQRVLIFYVTRHRVGPGAGPGDSQGDGPGPELGDTPRDGGEIPLTVLINPVIEIIDPELALGWEACLSLPGLAGQVPRHKAVRYRGLTLDGTEIIHEASGFHARVAQHEFDHLDGVLYPQRMTDLSTLTFTSELKARERAAIVAE